MHKSIPLDINCPLLSLIIPFHNTKLEQFKDLINNLKKLELNGVETIFINDHSNKEEDYLELIKQVSNYHYCNLIDGSGVSAARNLGIKKATGKYITFIDSDDVLNYYVFNKLIDELVDKDFYFFYQGVFTDKNSLFFNNDFNFVRKKVDRDEIERMYLYYKLSNDINIALSMRSACGKFFKHDTIKHLFDEELKFYEDSLFVANYIKDNPVINGEIINATLYYYRIDFKSASRKFNKSYNFFYQTYFDHYIESINGNEKYLLPISFDSIATVLPTKVVQAMKKFHFNYAKCLIKSKWANQSAVVLLKYEKDLDEMTFGIISRVVKHHYGACLFYILCNRAIKSIKIRSGKLFKHGK